MFCLLAITSLPVYACGLGPGSQATYSRDVQLNVRSYAGTNNAVIGSLRRGDVVDVLNGPESANGYVWWQVRLPSGTVGWAAEGSGGEYWLEPHCKPAEQEDAAPASETSLVATETVSASSPIHNCFRQSSFVTSERDSNVKLERQIAYGENFSASFSESDRNEEVGYRHIYWFNGNVGDVITAFVETHNRRTRRIDGQDDGLVNPPYIRVIYCFPEHLTVDAEDFFLGNGSPTWSKYSESATSSLSDLILPFSGTYLLVLSAEESSFMDWIRPGFAETYSFSISLVGREFPQNQIKFSDTRQIRDLYPTEGHSNRCKDSFTFVANAGDAVGGYVQLHPNDSSGSILILLLDSTGIPTHHQYLRTYNYDFDRNGVAAFSDFPIGVTGEHSIYFEQTIYACSHSRYENESWPPFTVSLERTGELESARATSLQPLYTSEDSNLLYERFLDANQLDNQEIKNTGAFLEAVRVLSVDRGKGAKVCFALDPGDVNDKAFEDFRDSGFLFLDERYKPSKLEYLHSWNEADEQGYRTYCVAVDKPGTIVRVTKNEQTQALWMSKFDQDWWEGAVREASRRTIGAVAEYLGKKAFEKLGKAISKGGASIKNHLGHRLSEKFGNHLHKPEFLKKIKESLSKSLIPHLRDQLHIQHYQAISSQYYNQYIGQFQAEFGDDLGEQLAREYAASATVDQIDLLAVISSKGMVDEAVAEIAEFSVEEVVESQIEDAEPLSEELLGPAISDFLFEEGLESGSIGDTLSDAIDDYIGETAADVTGLLVDLGSVVALPFRFFGDIYVLAKDTLANIVTLNLGLYESLDKCHVTVNEKASLRAGAKGFPVGTVAETAKFKPIARNGDWVMVDMGGLGHLGDDDVSGGWVKTDYLDLEGDCGSGRTIMGDIDRGVGAAAVSGAAVAMSLFDANTDDEEQREQEEQEQPEQEEQEQPEQEEPDQPEQELQEQRDEVEQIAQENLELQVRRDEVERIAQAYIDEVEQEPIDQASTSSLRPGDDYDEHPLPPSTEARTVTVSINSEDGDLQPGFDVWCDGEKVATSHASRSGGATSETVTLRGDCSISAWSVTGGGRYELTIKES